MINHNKTLFILNSSPFLFLESFISIGETMYITSLYLNKTSTRQKRQPELLSDRQHLAVCLSCFVYYLCFVSYYSSEYLQYKYYGFQQLCMITQKNFRKKNIFKIYLRCSGCTCIRHLIDF